ncbi:hypothetical protein ACFXJO_01685 [Streptomyces lavendulae]|uniref:hypothetical protein n=1 Tax=Streptomyces lavendulae TaxID=1914 RepID=UPI00367B05E5
MPVVELPLLRVPAFASAAASLLAACATVPLIRKPRPAAAESPDPAKAGAA